MIEESITDEAILEKEHFEGFFPELTEAGYDFFIAPPLFSGGRLALWINWKDEKA
tara:strand:- start:1817 stop:1981 length:165 start_codon:yes stop_codon:yes gene_type:complete